MSLMGKLIRSPFPVTLSERGGTDKGIQCARISYMSNVQQVYMRLNRLFLSLNGILPMGIQFISHSSMMWPLSLN